MEQDQSDKVLEMGEGKGLVAEGSLPPVKAPELKLVARKETVNRKEVE